MLNIALAIVWAALWGSFTLFQLTAGFLVGFATLWIAQPLFGGPSPYYLRAYFAWKLGLPLGYRHCDRGNSRRPARCRELRTNQGNVLRNGDESAAAAFSRFLRRSVSYVHSGSGRTAPRDDETDLFLTRLREVLA